jgi:environmental stress-induced protein Ves
MICVFEPKSTIEWSGGTSSEWFIFPKITSYQNRDFSLRISSATVNLSPISFTPFPAYQRLICITKGEGEIAINGKAVKLSKTDLIAFSGADEVISEGIFEDFNILFHPSFDVKIKMVVYSIEAPNIMLPASTNLVFFLSGEFLVDGMSYRAPFFIEIEDINQTLSLSGHGVLVSFAF